MCVTSSNETAFGGVGTSCDQPRLNAGPVSHGSAKSLTLCVSRTNEAWLTQRTVAVEARSLPSEIAPEALLAELVLTPFTTLVDRAAARKTSVPA